MLYVPFYFIFNFPKCYTYLDYLSTDFKNILHYNKFNTGLPAYQYVITLFPNNFLKMFIKHISMGTTYRIHISYIRIVIDTY